MEKVRQPKYSRSQRGERALPSVATSLRLWQHSRLLSLGELTEELQDRVLILRNHPQVCAMSHNRKPISYAAHRDYLRELRRRQPRFVCCALFCDAIRLLKGAGPLAKDFANIDGLTTLRPIVGVVSVDLRLDGRPLLGLYKNLYHYPHIKMGRTLLFAALLRASALGCPQVFVECYKENLAMQKLAREFGFLAQEAEGDLLRFCRAVPNGKKLLQDPMFADFAELEREAVSLCLSQHSGRGTKEYP